MTLTQAAYWTRRLGVLVLGAIAIFVIATLIILSLPSNNAPSEYLQANYACTEFKDEFLQNKLSIPSLTLDAGSDLVFEIETVTGKVDSLPRIINVHKFNNAGQSLNSQGEAKIIAGKLGFNPDEIQRRGTAEYMWTNSITHKTLVVQARNLNFSLTTDFTKQGALPADGVLPSDNEAISNASSYLKSKGLLLEDYVKQPAQVVYIDVAANGTFSQARSKVDAELVRVDFYRKASMISIRSDIEGADNMKTELERKLFQATTDSVLTDKGRIDIYNFDTLVTFENPNVPNISVYIGPLNKQDPSSDTTNKYVYGAEFTYWPIDTEPCGTYTLIPPATALDIVQQGKGSLVYLNEKNGDDVVPYTPKKVRKFTIYNVTIGYYESPAEQKYLQPVYIISGEATLDSGIIGNFHYYVPAIDYENVGDRVIIETAEEVDPDADTFLGN
ncbi:MAG TPA: hypothetical protein PLV59_02350 [Candidatus Dojkabacteria bacterium]|nr:hypothetical protein [Candidatus Dojkabacteria bacterium]